MKFWKKTLFASFLLSAILITVFYTACEKDTCDNLTCYNGGACGNGKCSCPTGYENTQCQTKSVTRFLGVYPGYSQCNTPDQVIDTAFIYADTTSPATVNYVWVVLKSFNPEVLHGYVQANQSTYSIIVPEDTSANYSRTYTITLQNNTALTIASWEDDQRTPGDTIISKCKFTGTVDTAL